MRTNSPPLYTNHKHIYTLPKAFKSKVLTFSFSQQKFKKLIESTGKYGLVNGKVVDLEEDPDAPAAPPSTPAKRGRGGKAAGTPRTTSGRKRKAPAKNKDDSENEESDADGDTAETPAKKRATTKRGAAKAAAQKVKEEASGNDEEDAEGDKNGDDDGEKSDEEDNDNPDVV